MIFRDFLHFLAKNKAVTLAHARILLGAFYAHINRYTYIITCKQTKCKHLTTQSHNVTTGSPVHTWSAHTFPPTTHSARSQTQTHRVILFQTGMRGRRMLSQCCRPALNLTTHTAREGNSEEESSLETKKDGQKICEGKTQKKHQQHLLTAA